MDTVREFLKKRDGIVSVAVVDSKGGMREIRGRRSFVSASLPKAMLLVAHLRAVRHERRRLSSFERAQLWRMITDSSNRAATWTYARVGDERLRRLARRAGMKGFSICCSWARAYASARDWALFFGRLERLTPRRFRAYALRLLRSIRERQSWGIAKVAPTRGFEIFHKPGWRPTLRGHLVHQAATLSRDDVRFSVAVLTDANPSYGYGMGTIAGVTRRLLRDVTRPGTR